MSSIIILYRQITMNVMTWDFRVSEMSAHLKTYYNGQIFSCHLVYAFIHLNVVQMLQKIDKYSSDEEKRNIKSLFEFKVLRCNATCGWTSSERQKFPCNPFASVCCFFSLMVFRPSLYNLILRFEKWVTQGKERFVSFCTRKFFLTSYKWGLFSPQQILKVSGGGSHLGLVLSGLWKKGICDAFI